MQETVGSEVENFFAWIAANRAEQLTAARHQPDDRAGRSQGAEERPPDRARTFVRHVREQADQPEPHYGTQRRQRQSPTRLAVRPLTALTALLAGHVSRHGCAGGARTPPR